MMMYDDKNALELPFKKKERKKETSKKKGWGRPRGASVDRIEYGMCGVSF
jgi:hypothetical protein